MPEQYFEEPQNFTPESAELKSPDFFININPEAQSLLQQQGIVADGTSLKFPNSSQYHGAGLVDFGQQVDSAQGMELKPIPNSKDIKLTVFSPKQRAETTKKLGTLLS